MMTASSPPRLIALLAGALLLAAAAGCDGSGADPEPAPQAVSATQAGTVGKEPGEVWTAGYNSDGQLGRPTKGVMDVALGPARGMGGRGTLRGVMAVAAGRGHSLAILDGGRVVAWGANDEGQLGDGTRTDRAAPVPVRAPDRAAGFLTGAVAVAADTDFSMALLSNGTVVTWGTGDAGQRGIGRRRSPLTPTTVKDVDGKGPLSGVTAIAADGRTELALLKNGTVLGWGANNYGMVGDGTTQNRSLPRQVRGLDGAPALTGVVQISIGGQHGMARLRDGTVVSWGRNDSGQLGDGTQRDRGVPGHVIGLHGLPILRNVVAITSGEKHNFALRGDGTVVAWGNNVSGQLGNGTVSDSPRPVSVVGAQSTLLRGVAQVYAGESYGVVVLTDGTTLTWGSGGKGQLGSGNRVPRSRPGPIVLAGGRAAGKIVGVGTGQRHLQLLMRW